MAEVIIRKGEDWGGSGGKEGKPGGRLSRGAGFARRPRHGGARGDELAERDGGEASVETRDR
jgi:hypothetical protein